MYKKKSLILVPPSTCVETYIPGVSFLTPYIGCIYSDPLFHDTIWKAYCPDLFTERIVENYLHDSLGNERASRSIQSQVGLKKHRRSDLTKKVAKSALSQLDEHKRLYIST